jgi:hypothetical protein
MNREYLRNLKAETENKILEKAIEDAIEDLTTIILNTASTSNSRKIDINVFNHMEKLNTNFSKRVLPVLKNRFGDVGITLKTMEYNQLELVEIVDNTEFRGLCYYNLCVDWS